MFNNFRTIALSATVAITMTGCLGEQGDVSSYEMPVDKLYAKLKERALLKPMKSKSFNESGKHTMVDNRTNEYVTWAYGGTGETHYWYTATLEKVDENNSRIKLEFFPSSRLAKIPAGSRNMLYAASAERIAAHLEGRERNGKRAMMRSSAFIVMNPVSSYSDIAKMRNEAIAAAKKDGLNTQ